MQFLGAGASSRPQDSAQNGIKTRSGLVLNVAEQARPTMTMHPKQADLPAESDRSRSGMQDGATSYPSRWIGEGETGRGRVDDAWPEGRLYTENCENASEQRVSARRGTERCEIKVNSWECNTGTTGIGCRGDGMKDSCDGTGLEDAWPYCGRFHLAELKVIFVGGDRFCDARITAFSRAVCRAKKKDCSLQLTLSAP